MATSMSCSDGVDRLAGRTLMISGGSRGIGLAIALRAARDGANVALLAKTAVAHPTLPGSLGEAAEAIERAGGRALPIVGDVRDAATIEDAVARAVEAFGRIDVCVNNASAIDLSPSRQLTAKRYDLMQAVNSRATFLLSRACVPHLKRSDNPHILTLSPPLNLDPAWLAPHIGYTISKFGMSLCTLGLAAELAPLGIAANSLWPRTTIATAAVAPLSGDAQLERSRVPEIVADAAHALVCRPAGTATGRLAIDEDVLREEGVTDFDRYAVAGGPLDLDLFVGAAPALSVGRQ